MAIEFRLRGALERDAASVSPDVPAALREVRARDRRSRTRRRVAVGAALAGVVLVTAVVAQLGGPRLDRGQGPVSPPGGDDRSERVRHG